MTAYDDAVLADSPAAYYPLEETGTPASYADLSGNDRDLTNLIAAPTPAAPLFPLASGSQTFANDVIRSASPFVLSSGSYTAEVWATVTSVVDSRTWIADDSGGAGFDEFRLRMNEADTSLRLSVGGTSVDSVEEVASIVDITQPHHYVGVFDAVAGEVRFYVDGVLFDTVATGASMAGATRSVQVGARRISAGNQNFHAGRLSHAALYPSALSAGRIAAHYDAAQGTTGPPWSLTVDTVGEGTVEVEDDGTPVDPTTYEWDDESTATLLAVPDAGSVLDDPLWTGVDVPSGQENANPLLLTMTKNQSVVANFDVAPPLPAPENLTVEFGRIEAGRVYFEASADLVDGADVYECEARIRGGLDEGGEGG